MFRPRFKLEDESGREKGEEKEDSDKKADTEKPLPVTERPNPMADCGKIKFGNCWQG